MRRGVERAASDTVAAADTLLGLEVDNTVSVLNDRPFRRTCLQAAGIGALRRSHPYGSAALQFVVLKPLPKRITVEFRGRQPGCHTPRRYCPLHHGCRSTRARHLTRFAADTGGDVDEFRHLFTVVRARGAVKSPLVAERRGIVLRLISRPSSVPMSYHYLFRQAIALSNACPEPVVEIARSNGKVVPACEELILLQRVGIVFKGHGRQG